MANQILMSQTTLRYCLSSHADGMSERLLSTWPDRYLCHTHKHHSLVVGNGMLRKDPGWAQNDSKDPAFDLGQSPCMQWNGKVQSGLNAVC